MSGRPRCSFRQRNTCADVGIYLFFSYVLTQHVVDMIAMVPQRNVGSSRKAAPRSKSRGLTSVLTLVHVSCCQSICLLHIINDPVSIAPANGVQLKIWQCYDNLPAQQWYYTGDNRIALENQGVIYPCFQVCLHPFMTTQACAQIWRMAL